jgi:hypothetical protein
VHDGVPIPNHRSQNYSRKAAYTLGDSYGDLESSDNGMVLCSLEAGITPVCHIEFYKSPPASRLKVVCAGPEDTLSYASSNKAALVAAQDYQETIQTPRLLCSKPYQCGHGRSRRPQSRFLVMGLSGLPQNRSLK